MSEKSETELMEASYELHNMALEAVDLIVNDNTLLDLFYINKDLWPAIKASWKNSQTDFQGRFDFAWDGKNPPKLLEYNADTPSLQIESGKLSTAWFNNIKQRYNSDYYQSNYLDQSLRHFAPTLFNQCNNNRNSFFSKKIGVLVNVVDEENVAVMKYMMNLFSKLHQKDMTLTDIS